MKKAMFHHVTPHNLRILQLDETLFEVDNFHSRYVDDAISTVDMMTPHLRQGGLFQPLFGFFEESDDDGDDLITLEIGQSDIFNMFGQLRWTHERCMVEFTELCFNRMTGGQGRNINISTEYADALATRLEWLGKLMTAFGIALRKNGAPIFITNDANFKVEIEEDEEDEDDTDLDTEEDDRDDDDDDAEPGDLDDLADTPDHRYEILRNVSFKDLRAICIHFGVLPKGAPSKLTLLNAIVDMGEKSDFTSVVELIRQFADEHGIALGKPFTQEQRVESYTLALMPYNTDFLKRLAVELHLKVPKGRLPLLNMLATCKYNRKHLRQTAAKIGFKLDI